MGAKADTPRDRDSEQMFLTAAAARSGSDEFLPHAQGRLEVGEERFGNRWTALTLLEFLRELEEEAADLGAWTVLAVQHLEHMYSVSHQQRAALLERLEEIAHLGARAHRQTELARQILHPRRAA